jgi:hypothetical protein
MTKKTNTILFIIAATGFNVVLTMLVFALLFLFFFAVIRPLISDSYIIFGLAAMFLASVFLSFTLYRALLKLLFKKISAEEYFDVSFSFKKKSAPPDKPA